MNSHSERFHSFSEFWPFYLKEHSNLRCRQLHFVGSLIAALFILIFLVCWDVRWVVGALVAGYGCAWAGHFLFEKNRPATFRFPWYSFLGDWKMFWFILKGTIDQELQRYGISHQ